MKSIANEIFVIFQKYNKGQCSYDRSLQDVSIIINKVVDQNIINYKKQISIENTIPNFISKNNPIHILEHMDMDVIENYLRFKKISRIQKNMI